MKCWGLRGAYLSAVTKVGAGQKDLLKHLTPNILYMMLATVAIFNTDYFRFQLVQALFMIKLLCFLTNKLIN